MLGCSATRDDRFIPQGTHLLTITLPRSLLTHLGDLSRFWRARVVRPVALARGPAE